MTTFFSQLNTKHIIALSIFASLFICVFFAQWFVPHDPNVVDLSKQFLPSSGEHFLGTDHLGRDVFSRLLVAARYSLLTVSAILLVLVSVATLLGAFAASIGGIFDAIIMRICDGMMVFPTVVLALFLISVLGSGLENLIIAISATHLAWYTRLVRSYVLSLKNRDYVLASQSMGESRTRIIFRHFVPAVLGQICILATLDVGHMLLHVAGLSFLGLGIQPPTPEWGVMIAEAQGFLRTHPLLMLYPGLMIFLVTAASNLLGDALRDKLDPALHLEENNDPIPPIKAANSHVFSAPMPLMSQSSTAKQTPKDN